MADMNDKDSIKEILERAGASVDGGAVEFEFAERTALVFETPFSENKSAEAEEFDFASELEAEDLTEKASVSDTGAEFELPDIFDIEERSREIAEASGLVTTYVPRFTEVSENYRMRGAQTAGSSFVSKRTEEDGEALQIDPTSELVENTENVRVIDVEKENGTDSGVKTVYKFEDPTKEKPKPKIRTLEDEVREIDELMRVETDTENSSAAEQPDMQEAIENTPKFKVISDSAVREANRESLVKSETEEPAVAGASEKTEKKAKNRDFSAPLQRDGFKDRFLDQILSIRVRLIVAAFITLLLFAFENLSLVGVDLLSILRIPKYTGIPALLDLQLAVCVFVLAIPEIVNALSNLAGGRLYSELSVVLSLVVLGVYSITVYSINAFDYPLFGFLFAVHVDAALVSSLLKKSADFSSFKLVSGKEKKKALVITPTRDLPHENLALDGAVDEYKSKTVRTMRCAFVSDFFKRCGSASEKSMTTAVMMAISLGASLICAAVAYFIYDGVLSFVTALALVFLMAMPAFSVLTYKFVYYHGAASAKKDGFAVIGQSAFADYADADVMIFEDLEIFGEDDVKLRNFSGDMTRGMRQMSSLFSAVGGPLEKIFSSAVDRQAPAATEVIVEADGISGYVDGKLVYAGTEAYMLRRGGSFDGFDRHAQGSVDSSKIMYAAEDGDVYASFRISYSFSESFTMILPSLKQEKIVPLIVTRDPNVTNELIKTLTMGQDSIRVLKKTDIPPKSEPIERSASAGIIGVGERGGALHALLLCKKSAALTSRLALTELMALAVGAALGAALSLGGMAQAPTAALGLWQLLWCVGVGLLCYREFKNDKHS